MRDLPFIDVAGLDRAEILVALHERTRAIGLGKLHDRPLSLAEARGLALSQDFDYVNGRPLKIWFRGDRLYGAALYDRDCPLGPGSCQRIIDALKRGGVAMGVTEVASQVFPEPHCPRCGIRVPVLFVLLPDKSGTVASIACPDCRELPSPVADWRTAGRPFQCKRCQGPVYVGWRFCCVCGVEQERPS
jgi:hypothetical protein